MMCIVNKAPRMSTFFRYALQKQARPTRLSFYRMHTFSRDFMTCQRTISKIRIFCRHFGFSQLSTLGHYACSKDPFSHVRYRAFDYV